MSGQWVGGKRLRKRKERKKVWKQSLLFWLGDSNPYKACLFWWQEHKSLVALTDTLLSPSGPPDTSYYLLGFFLFLIKKRFRSGVLGVNQLTSVLLNITITEQPRTVHPAAWLSLCHVSCGGREVTSYLTFKNVPWRFLCFVFEA